MKRLAVLAGVVAVLGLVLGTVAFAKVKNIRANLTIANPQAGQYQGAVDPINGNADQQKFCRDGRRVMVWHDVNANGEIDPPPGPDFKIGETRTKKDGTWVLFGNQAPIGDQLIAIVVAKRKPELRCRGTRKLGRAGQ